MKIGTRRIVHCKLTAHPTAEWTAQQLRMIIPGDQPHRFVIHDRDTIYSEGVDRTLAAMCLAVLKTPARAPTANASCELGKPPREARRTGLGTARDERSESRRFPTDCWASHLAKRGEQDSNLRPPGS